MAGLHSNDLVVVCCLETTALRCHACGTPLLPFGRPWVFSAGLGPSLAFFGGFSRFCQMTSLWRHHCDVMTYDVMGECEWTECEAGWAFLFVVCFAVL